MTEWNVSVEPPSEFKAGESVFNSKEYVDEWMDTLPAAATGEASRLLYQAYQELALHPIKPAIRFHFMERSTQVFFGILRGLEQKVYRGGFPLNEANSKTAQMLLGMLGLQLINYRVILSDLQASLLAGGLRRRHIQQHSLLRILELLGEMFELYRHIDVPPAPGLWSLYNRFYLLAEVDKILATRLLAMDGHTQTCIGTEFKLQQLLEPLNPHDFRSNEYSCLKIAIRSLARDLKFSNEGHVENSSSFCLRLDEDAPTSFFEPERVVQHADSPYRRCLNISKLTSKLALFIQEDSDHLDLGQCQLSRHAARMMLNGWKIMADSRSLRENTTQTIQLAHGLSNIAMVLMQENLKDTNDGAAPAPKGEQEHEVVIYGDAPHFGSFTAEVDGVDLEHHREKLHDEADLWNTSYITIVQPSASWTDNFRKDSDASTMQGLLIDQSPAGMGIALDLLYQDYQFQIGDLLAIKLDEAWLLLSIRWIRHHPDGIRMGLRRLGKNIRTQTLVVSRKGKPSQPMPMLHIEHQRGVPAVVLHNINIHPHDTLIFSEGGTSVQIRVGELLDTSAVFECYQLDRSSMQ
ncbi:MAG: hypothetical protein K0A95_06000 [Chromatiales bacterium]|nr:hypothetical protein [Gammaproteobacteria bacterium]MBW6476606.1 hypothetical protein [Chromatiales bacterium]